MTARNAVAWLVGFHIIAIIASNYLVQYPFVLAGFHTTWGAFTFPFIFLATDLTVRLIGKVKARRVITIAMLPALMASYAVGVLFERGELKGFVAFAELNTFVARIALASACAYAFGQLLDVVVFDRIRRASHRWWAAPLASSVLGQAIDTLLFFSIAFYASQDAFMAANWPEIAGVDYVFKLFISTLFFLPLYGVLLAAIMRSINARPNSPPTSP